ncbi:MAG: DNA-3-methyladenine glycosylase 2 [Vulcanimicrobiota bacterium]
MRILCPPDYRPQEVWSFHARDQQQLCEEVGAGRLVKRFVLDGRPTRLEIAVGSKEARVSGGQGSEAFQAACRLLGLGLDPGPFEAAFAQDAYLGPLIAARPGLRLAQTATAYEAVTWAIMGQQVNLTFALELRRTFIRLADVRLEGAYCYPDPAAAARLDWDELPRRKFSRAKAETLRRVTELLLRQELDLARPEQLLAVKGVGPWTVQYTLLRGYAHPDCSLHGDAAVKKALQGVFGQSLTSSEAEQLLARYRPHRSLAAAHCWAWLNKQA